jgi:hypothetical protein
MQTGSSGLKRDNVLGLMVWVRRTGTVFLTWIVHEKDKGVMNIT